MLIDSHCHLNSIKYKDFTLSEILKKAKDFNINKFLSISVDYSSSKENINIKKKFKEILITIGLHPNYIAKDYQIELERILKLFNNEYIAGIGEIGLDYFKNFNSSILQREVFEKQISFAVSHNKPIVVHTRKAFRDTCEIIKNSNYSKFIIHCFTGDLDEVKKYLNLGCYISFSGIITFKNSNDIRDAAKYVPLSRLLVETDSPYLSPEPFRGKLNFPKNLIYIVNELAIIKNTTANVIAEHTSKNFNEIFKQNSYFTSI